MPVTTTHPTSQDAEGTVSDRLPVDQGGLFTGCPAHPDNRFPVIRGRWIMEDKFSDREIISKVE
jgi:hypothetical protein